MQEIYTSTQADHRPMSSHPEYGYKAAAYDNKMHFVGTESAFHDGGYLEGCIVSMEKLLKTLKS